ncbi:MBL fold metallo-hydrolase [Nocardioides sp. NPDC092400]|uniref:MBL fold metallo-hydrolase n=1 Tax=Nocardioides sp. NPDC092400 TaxID=3155196 RepID=UPI00343CF1FE
MFTLAVLGTATPHPLPDRACSGYLVTAGDTRVWVDAGPGSLANLQRHTALTDVDAIWISHLHADHSADLLGAFYALAYGGPRVEAPIPVHAPSGLLRRLSGFLDRPDLGGALAPHLALHDLHDGHEVRIGDLALRAAAVQHDVEAYGLRATYEGKVLAFSGDTGPCTSLDALAERADLLLCEAESDRWTSDAPQGHHTPEDAGALARRAGAGRLLVTHVGPTLTPEAATARAAHVFGGPTACARENEVHAIG